MEPVGWAGVALSCLEGGQAALVELDEGGISEVFNWDELAEVLSRVPLGWPRLRVFSDGQPVPDEAYSFVGRRGERQLSPGGLYSVLDAGASLVVDGVDQLERSAEELARSFEATFGCVAFINAYASWGPVSAFDRHWDDHDVFVIQISGSKLWNVWPATRSWPMDRDTERPTDPVGPPREFEALPGSLLFLPQGWWHSASAQACPSLHLTIGVRRDSYLDVAAWFVDELVDDDEVRAPIDIASTTPVESALQDLMNGQDVLDRFTRARIAALPIRTRVTLPRVGFGDLDQVRYTSPLVDLENIGEQDSVRLTTAGKAVELGKWVLPLLEALRSPEGCSVDELGKIARTDEISSDELGAFLHDLLSAGVISVVRQL